MQNLAILIIFLPLFSALINGLLVKRINRKHASIVATATMLIVSLLAAIIFYHVGINDNVIHITLSKWWQFGSLTINWAIYIDRLTSIMFIVVTWVSMAVHIYSLGYMSEDKGLVRFLSFLSLFTFFMLALVSADNFLQLFFGWEGVGLCSYLLIGFWYNKDSANKAAIKAFIVNRIGDFAFILGIVMIILYTDHADFTTVFSVAPKLAAIKLNIIGVEFTVIDLICLLLFLGCMGKSAQIGLHVWLPDAMEGPTPVSALIHAATMVTAGVFLVARCSYLFEYSPCVLQIIAIVGGVTCLFAATIAVTQTDIKKIIAYSTCSQLGYMFLACGVSAYQAGIFHLVTHAFFKALLFLSAGSVIHACHEQDILKIGGLKDKMPITYTNFWLGSLAISGIYPLAGFYSKDLILESAYSSGRVGHIVFILGIIAAVLTAIYSMKIMMLVFHGNSRLEDKVFKSAHEAPKVMNLPLALLVAGTLLSGMIGHYILHIGKAGGYFFNSIASLNNRPAEHDISLLIKLLPLIAGAVGIIIGVGIYRQKIASANIFAKKMNFIYKLLYNKYYFDQFYDWLIVRPTTCCSRLCNLFDQGVIDRLGPAALSKIVNNFSKAVSNLQTGYIFNYAFIIISAVVVCITALLITWQMSQG